MIPSHLTIYAVADIHGSISRLERIGDQVDALKPDVLVLAGDITGPRTAAADIRRLNDLPVPVLAIRGNMDGREMDAEIEACPNVASLERTALTVKGVKFVGLGGRLSFRGEAIEEAVSHLATDDILVVHPPPYGALDEGFGNIHAGSRGLRRIVEEKQPKLLICGHIHEKPGWMFLGKTLVVNCSIGHRGAGALIVLNGDQAPSVQML